MAIKIYHNPRCSKSRQTLALLQERNIEPEIVEYLKTPPRVEEIEDLLRKLGAEPREIIRSGEAEYKDAGLDDQSLSRDQLIRAIHEHPKLLQRPIVVVDDKATIGRPPEQVLEILP